MKKVCCRLAKKGSVLFCAMLMVSGAMAQLPTSGGINPSQMSNQQIIMLWQQAQMNGGSNNDAIKQLMRSGLKSSDVNAFKKRLLQAQSSATLQGSKLNTIKDTSGFLRDSGWVQSVPELRKTSPYYGFDFFSNPDVTFEASLAINPPKSYVLGPGDAITVNLTGVNEKTISASINRDGSFQVPYAGILTLSGLTMAQAEQKLKSKMSVAYPALNTGQTQLFLTLDNSRNISVYVIGEAEKPGKYTVSALSGFFNVLYLSQGPSQQGSLRKIELIRNNKVVETVDFYNFLQKGLFTKELKLEDQDVIRFPTYNKRVTLDGAVRHPAIFELLDQETLADLIKFAGGFEGNAFQESAKVVQVGGTERKVRDINRIDFPNFIPQSADSVHIDYALTTYSNRVVISGAVRRPGVYELSEGLTLSALLTRAAGLREDALTTLGYIKRRKQETMERELISFDLRSVKPGAPADIKLVKDDSVVISSRDSMRDVPHVTVAGNVREPGIFEFRQGMSVEDAILMAGGFTNDAAIHKIEISRIDKNRADTLANQVSNTIRVQVDSSLAGITSAKLQPLDYIFVPRLLNYRLLGNVRIRGEVLNEGDYTLERRDETVQELVARAGGVSPYASLENTQVYRNGIRVATTVFADKNSGDRFLLLPGDSVYIPRDVPFVEVQGQVFNPQMLRYDGGSFLSYISEAGGTTEKANLKRSYVQYSNGINRKIKHFLFFRIYPKVLAGSRIIVPEKLNTERRGISVIEVSALAGVLSALVGMIAVLK